MGDLLNRLETSPDPLCREAANEIRRITKTLNLDAELVKEKETEISRLKQDVSKLKEDIDSVEVYAPPKLTYRELREASRNRRYKTGG